MGSHGSTIFGDGDELEEIRRLRPAKATNELSKLKISCGMVKILKQD